MDMDNKRKIKAVYAELQGYLSQTPKPNQVTDLFPNDSPWLQYNDSIRELEQLTGENYDRFIIKPEKSNGFNIVQIMSYRQTLGGIISRIHSIYFSDETPPFSGTPQTIISQSQNQSQSIQMLLDIQSKIENELTKAKGDGQKEGFLSNLKGKLSHVKDVNDLLKLILKTAKDFNINLMDLVSMFGQ
jgi:hypothetical protein